MDTVFLELLFDAADCAKAGLGSRDEIEDELIEKLHASGLGEVTGGGGGQGFYNIDVEVFKEHQLAEALAVIRLTLVELNVPRGSKIVRYQPGREEFPIYVWG